MRDENCIQRKSEISEHAIKDCIFCKIIEGKIPTNKIYENEHIFAFLDINPVSKGHTLVVPKEHYEKLEDVPDELLKEIMKAVKHIGKAVMKATNSHAYNLGVNNGRDAGQVVMHAHFHIMPRQKGDGLELWQGKPYADGEINKVKDSIVKFI